jgi:hypothetical protein
VKDADMKETETVSTSTPSTLSTHEFDVETMTQDDLTKLCNKPQRNSRTPPQVRAATMSNVSKVRDSHTIRVVGPEQRVGEDPSLQSKKKEYQTNIKEQKKTILTNKADNKHTQDKTLSTS